MVSLLDQMEKSIGSSEMQRSLIISEIVSTVLYGRKTFEMMEHYWPTAWDKTTATQHDIDHAQWYTWAHKIVLSTTMQDPERSDITIIGDNLLEQIDAIKQQPGKDIFIFGSPTATHALMKHNRIDEYWLFVNPIILWHGVPLFQGIRETMTLNLLTTRRFACWVMELNYAVNREISRKQNEWILL